MKRISVRFVAALLLFATQISSQQGPSADQVMHSVAQKLASVKQLGYKYDFELSAPSKDRNFAMRADAFLDLRPADKGSKFRFQFTAVDRFSVFNGAERFTVDKKGKKLYVENKPSFDSFGDTLLL